MLHKLGSAQQKTRSFAPSTTLGDQKDRYVFVLEYYDEQADLTRQYQASYFGFDDTIEIFDVKLKRVFLKRTTVPNVTLENFYIGAKVTIFSRLMTVVEFGDDYTYNRFGNFSQKTLALIKPDAYDNMGNIINEILKSKMRITKLKRVQLTKSQAESFYAEFKGESFFPEFVESVLSGPVVALEVNGKDSIEEFKKMMGFIDPQSAKESDDPVSQNSLRAKYGKSFKENAVHGSEDAQSAKKELDFFFGKTQKFDNYMQCKNCTLCVVKPHAIDKAGEILQKVLNEGYEIGAMQMFFLSKPDATDFLEVYKGVIAEYQALVDELSSGICFAFEVFIPSENEENVVDPFRDLCGPHDPELAQVIRPKSIRAMFGEDKVKNAVHCTDLAIDGASEVDFFFNLLQQRE